MARAALNWSLQQLAEVAGVHRNTISNFETGKYAGDPQTLSAIRAALEANGVEFTNGNEPGVRLKVSYEPPPAAKPEFTPFGEEKGPGAMGDIAKGIGVYRVFVDLPEDVTDEELGPLVTQLLKDGIQSHVSVDTIEFEIAKQIAAHFPRAVVTNQDRRELAKEIMELARASQS